MKKKLITGLIAIVAIVAVLIFAGCIEEQPPVSTPTPAAPPPTKTTPTPTPLPTLTPTSTPTSSSLEGRIWTLTNFIAESDGDVRLPITGTTITARFEDGQISGTAGCNQYSGSYTAEDKIVLNEMSWTEMLCMDPEGVMPPETHYLEILRDVTTYTIEENQLTLSTEDGRALMYHAKLDTTQKSEGALSVSELLEDPVYDTEVKVYGIVSALGEVDCLCFELTSGGELLWVWYDMMVEDDETERPAASVEGIENGNRVIVTGELKSGGQHCTRNDFWASEIENMAEEDVVEEAEAVRLANVKDIEIMLLESFPVQINVIAKGEHPDSCTKVNEITTRREGNTFFVTLTASRPADVMCAQVITPFEEVIALDVVGLKAGVYTVDVNGVRDTFELQMDNWKGSIHR